MHENICGKDLLEEPWGIFWLYSSHPCPALAPPSPKLIFQGYSVFTLFISKSIHYFLVSELPYQHCLLTFFDFTSYFVCRYLGHDLEIPYNILRNHDTSSFKGIILIDIFFYNIHISNFVKSNTFSLNLVNSYFFNYFLMKCHAEKNDIFVVWAVPPVFTLNTWTLTPYHTP